MYNWNDPVGSQYTCEPKVSYSGDNSTLTGLTGTHLIGKSNADVISLSVYSQLAEQIPKGIENFFPNLLTFNWSFAGLKKISAEDLKPFPNLMYLFLGGNNLVTLESDLFQYTLKLRRIYLFSNQLQHVGSNLLTNLNDLTFTYFHDNPCINDYAFTYETVQQLNLKLPISCPPLASTPAPPSSVCSSECSELIQALEQNVTLKISELQKVNTNQGGVIMNLDKRLAAFEKIYTDIWSLGLMLTSQSQFV
jgi:hypothetical protein